MRLGTFGLGAYLGVAAAACAGVIAVYAAPEKLAPHPSSSQISFAPKPQQKTFSATCNLQGGAVADSRPAPAWVNASYEHDDCTAPAPPARVNGLTASDGQIDAYLAAEKRYDAAADAYQRCIGHVVSARSAAAEEEKQSPDMSFVVIENHRIATSRVDEKKVSDEVTLAVEQFNSYGSDCPD
jgi:hypothetical protein